jgi:hypothetical protein
MFWPSQVQNVKTSNSDSAVSLGFNCWLRNSPSQVLCSYIYALTLCQISCTHTHTAREIFCNTAPRSFKQNTAITWTKLPLDLLPCLRSLHLVTLESFWSLKPVLIPFHHYGLYKIRKYGTAVVSNSIIIPIIFLS